MGLCRLALFAQGGAARGRREGAGASEGASVSCASVPEPDATLVATGAPIEPADGAPDLAFAIGFPAYLAVSNWVLFNANLGYERPYKPLLREGRGAWFKRYVLTYAIVGLLLPLLPETTALPSN